jgi:hypothetical protein
VTASNPRDKRGWRIPRNGTKSRKIYDMLVAGKKPFEIIKELGMTDSTIRVLIFNIKRPDKKNEYARNYFRTHPKRPRAKKERLESDTPSHLLPDGTIRYSFYVKKLVNVLGLTHTEALEKEREILEKERANKNRLQLQSSGGSSS